MLNRKIMIKNFDPRYMVLFGLIKIGNNGNYLPIIQCRTASPFFEILASDFNAWNHSYVFQRMWDLKNHFEFTAHKEIELYTIKENNLTVSNISRNSKDMRYMNFTCSIIDENDYSVDLI